MLHDRPRWTGNFVNPVAEAPPERPRSPLPVPPPKRVCLDQTVYQPTPTPTPVPRGPPGVLSCYGGIKLYMEMVQGQRPWPLAETTHDWLTGTQC